MKSYKHTTGTFIGKGGTQIFFQCWEANKPRLSLVILHGLGEHSGRYSALVESLAKKKISIYSMDHRGHGKSEGSRGHIDSFSRYTDDTKIFSDIIKQRSGDIPLFMYGHSMGGVIAIKYSLLFPLSIKGLILSSPGCKPVTHLPRWKENLIQFMGKYIPTITFSNGIKSEHLSHDSAVVDDYENDHLVHNKISARWYKEYSHQSAICLSNASELKMPLLIIHGKADDIIDFRCSEQLFNAALSKKKELHIFKGLYHELINEKEPDRSKVLKVITEWIDKFGLKKKSAAQKASTVKKSEKKPNTKKSSIKKPTAKRTKGKISPNSKKKTVTSKKKSSSKKKV